MNKKILPLLAFFVIFGGTLSADGAFYASLGWSPQISDYIWFASSPSNHTIKSSALGFNLTAEYIFDNGIGFGLDSQWGMIDSITMISGSDKYTITDSFGRDFYLRMSPQFVYAPLRNERHMISLGIGPSVTMFYLLSEYGDSFGEYTAGFTLNMRYRWHANDYLFLTAGLGITLEFFSFGQFSAYVYGDFAQFQISPVLGAGIRL